MSKSRQKAAYMISAVAEQYSIHPQTLRLYEREGLLKPSRSDGNTRLYTDDDLERLEVILKLTRDLGVNLAGVEIILNMREKMEAMQRQIEEFIAQLNVELKERGGGGEDGAGVGQGQFPDSGDSQPGHLAAEIDLSLETRAEWLTRTWFGCQCDLPVPSARRHVRLRVYRLSPAPTIVVLSSNGS